MHLPGLSVWSPPPPAAPAPGSTILLVEDNADHRDILSTLLHHHGYAVSEVVTAADAIEFIARQRPGLVLMDGLLPGMDGWSATARLKADPATASIPVVMLSAHPLPPGWPRPDWGGCDGYLMKPFVPARVLSEVQRWVEPTDRLHPAVLN